MAADARPTWNLSSPLLPDPGYKQQLMHLIGIQLESWRSERTNWQHVYDQLSLKWKWVCLLSL